MKGINMKENSKVNALLLITLLNIPTLTIPIKLAMGNGTSVWIANLIILIVSLYKNKSRISKKFIILFLSLNLLFLINILLVNYKSLIVDIYIEFLISSALAMYLAFQSIDYKYFAKCWYVQGVIGIAIWLCYLNIVTSGATSYMFFGVSMSFCFAIVFYRFLDKKKFYDLILLLIAYCLIAVLANRGAFLTINVIVILFVYLKFRYKVFLFLPGALLILIGLYVDVKKLIAESIYSINQFLIANNIDSYSFTKFADMLINGLAESSSGRDVLYNQALAILEKGISPKGVGYFQYITGINYPHNFILDVLLILGFFSIPLLIFMSMRILNFFKYEIDIFKKDMFLLLLLIIFIRLFLSSTFLYEVPFWAIVGILLNSTYKSLSYSSIPLRKLKYD